MSAARIETVGRVLAGAAAACVLASAAQARPARCFTSDDGTYPCQFVATDRQGSFQISAQGKPAIMLAMEEPDVAIGFAKFGGRNVALPGRYRRSKADPACWINDATGAKVCAR